VNWLVPKLHLAYRELHLDPRGRFPVRDSPESLLEHIPAMLFEDQSLGTRLGSNEPHDAGVAAWRWATLGRSALRIRPTTAATWLCGSARWISTPPLLRSALHI
jgi:hypothetical protein